MVIMLCIYVALLFDQVRASSEHVAEQRSHEEMKILAPNYPVKKRKLGDGSVVHDYVLKHAGKKCVDTKYIAPYFSDQYLSMPVSSKIINGMSFNECW